MWEIQETRVQSLGWKIPLEKGMATHASNFAWKIPWTQKPGGLQFMASQRVGHDWTTKHAHTHTHTQLFELLDNITDQSSGITIPGHPGLNSDKRFDWSMVTSCIYFRVELGIWVLVPRAWGLVAHWPLGPGGSHDVQKPFYELIKSSHGLALGQRVV